MPTLSAIVITRNEAARIGACLDSLAFCDERIVVDSGSTDETCAIAEARGALVVFNPWPGFGPQKNVALSLASGDWVLSLDADETVPPALAAEIRAAVNAGGPDAYRFPRLSSFCGRPMRHSGWYPDHVLRLFRRGTARFSDDIVHEKVVHDGKVGTLRTPLDHESVTRIEDAIGKMDLYSTLGARKMVTAGRRSSLGRALLHGGFTFFKTYVLKRGFLDGREGFLLAVLNAEGAYYKHVKTLRDAAPCRD